MDVRDAVFAAQNAGLRSLTDLGQQYPQHVGVAARIVAAVVRTLEKPPEERAESSSDDEYDHGALSDTDLLSDLALLILRRMEIFPADVDMQRWGIRAGRCLLLPFHDAKANDATSFPDLIGTTNSYVQLVLKAMDKLAVNATVVLWACQDLAALLSLQRAFVGVISARGGVEVCAGAMRQHPDNQAIQRWAGQVLLLCMFWDVRLQEAAKNEGLLPHCKLVLQEFEDDSDDRDHPLVDIFTCILLMLEAVGKIHPANAELLTSRYDDGTLASIVSTEAVPNHLGAKLRYQAALTLTRFFRYIVSSKRMDIEGGESFLAVIKAVLARQNADRNSSHAMG
ncbi:unnamed protein product [Aphanomyces euteiches]